MTESISATRRKFPSSLGNSFLYYAWALEGIEITSSFCSQEADPLILIKIGSHNIFMAIIDRHYGRMKSKFECIYLYMHVFQTTTHINYALFCGCHLNLSNHDCFRRHTVKVYVDFINNWNGSAEQIITQIGANKTGDLWLWNWDCFHSLTWCIVECLMWYNLINQVSCWGSCE